ncbi:hypothetical protein [Aphanothece minutissima]|uniref:Neurotransmitter-gated ion-channel ligand-binding domain-containing protein n=1 Tax=Aphanothece cf. minutissima CCALA 015 TaxID=2107695 RepID=A0ABX5F477_9CHRO|nr:hypothetical protein [Aphanothece minutissima]PSB36176.1 hypothetical protein C7B81_14365 [Aphanothece cf. minutissima CCALA 015]
MGQRRRWWLGLVVLLIGVLVAVRTLAPDRGPMPRELVQEETIRVDPRTELARGSGYAVTLGSYIENLHSLSLRQRMFNAEGFYWLEWPKEVQELLEKQGITALQLVELTNQVNSSSAQIQADTPTPVARPGDRFYQLFRYSASFYIPVVDLKRSPFERLILPILFEVVPDAFARQNKNVVLVHDGDSKSSQIGAYATINGYDIEDVRFVSSSHSYGTDWGMGQGDLDYSRLAAEVVMRSDLFSSFVTWILPLLIVMLIVLLAPSLVGELGDVRLAIPSTALLTLIFLQQSYKAELPSLSYLTFLDCLYAYSYIVSLVLFVLFLWGTNVYSEASEQERTGALRRINRMDRVFQLTACAGFVLIAIWAWLA